jgi:hypothetical protein
MAGTSNQQVQKRSRNQQQIGGFTHHVGKTQIAGMLLVAG